MCVLFSYNRNINNLSAFKQLVLRVLSQIVSIRAHMFLLDLHLQTLVSVLYTAAL